MEVSINGGPFVRYTTAANEYLSPVVTTTATTDRLAIAFRAVSGSWVINGLEVADHAAATVISLPPVTEREINQVHPLLFTGIEPGIYWVYATAGQVLDANGNGSINQVTVGADGELSLSVTDTVAQSIDLWFDALNGSRRYETIVTFIAPAVRRFDFNHSSASVSADGYTGVLPRETYSTSIGYGWNSSASSVERSGVTASPTALFSDKHGTSVARTFLVDAVVGQAYDVRLHLGDSVARNMEVSVNGGPFVRYTTAANEYLSPVVTTTATTDRLAIAFRAVSGSWVINGLEVATSGRLPTNPLRPSTSLLFTPHSLAKDSRATRTASDVENVIGVLNEESLAATIQEALNRWAKAGIDDTTFARMQSVVFEIVDLDSQDQLGQAGHGIIRIDDDGLRLGWFIDPNPSSDDAFVSPGVHQSLAIAGQPSASHFDLLTVVMHELGHIAGYPDLIATTTREPTLMTETLPVGVRRIPVVNQDASIFAWTGDLMGTPHALAFQLQQYRETHDLQARNRSFVDSDDNVTDRATRKELQSPSQHQQSILHWPDEPLEPSLEPEEDWDQLQFTESDDNQQMRLNLIDEVFTDF